MKNINAENVSLSGETVSADTMRADAQAESAFSEGVSHCAGTAVGPTPIIVDNVHAENVSQESESTVGTVLKIADMQAKNVYLRDVRQSVEAADGAFHAHYS